MTGKTMAIYIDNYSWCININKNQDYEEILRNIRIILGNSNGINK